MTNQTAELDAAFRALADPTRRAVLARLARGPAPVGELAAPFDMALPTILQHLKVLEAGGLVRSRKEGRVRICEIPPAALAPVEGWLAMQKAMWDGRLDRLDAYVGSLAAARDAKEPPE